MNARIIASAITIVYAATGVAVYHKTHASTDIPSVPVDTMVMISTTIDCAKAHSDADRLICGDPELAYDETRVQEALSAAKDAAQDKDEFRLTVTNDWTYREGCHDKPCLVSWYERFNRWIDRVRNTGRVDY